MDSSKEEILNHIREIRESMTEEHIKEATGEDLVECLMEICRLEALLMTIIDDYSREIK